MWEIPRTKPRNRGGLFYIILLVIMALLLLFSIWQHDILFGIFVVLATGTILFLSEQKPHNYTFTITNHTIKIGDEVAYDISRFSHFDIYEFSNDDQELFLVFRERFKPMLRIRIYKRDSERITQRLREQLPRRKTDPSLIDILSNIVGI